MTYTTRWAIGVAALALAGTGQAKTKDGEERPIATSRSVQPMMTVMVAPRPKERTESLGGYTRLLIDFSPPDAPPPGIRNYDEERRNWLRRYFAGKSIARLVSVKATLARPRVSTSATLVSIGYSSNRKVGESWSSEFDSNRVLTPFFRIDADSAMSVEATTSASSTYDLSAAAGVLDVVKRAAALVAPTGALITSLNKERFEDASTFVDQSISNLLQESITERAINDFPVKDSVGHDLVTVTIWLSTGNAVSPKRSHPKPSQEMKALGSWTIRAAPATLSIFSDTPLLISSNAPGKPATAEGTTRPRRNGARAPAKTEEAKTISQCAGGGLGIAEACDAFKSLDPQTVLNFQVDTGVPLSQAIAGDAGVAAARERLIKASADPENANALCSVVADKAHVLGFNRFDVAAILWAYAAQAFISREASDQLRDENNCAPLKLAYSVGLPKDGFAGAKAEVKLAPPAASVVLPVQPLAPNPLAPVPMPVPAPIGTPPTGA